MTERMRVEKEKVGWWAHSTHTIAWPLHSLPFFCIAGGQSHSPRRLREVWSLHGASQSGKGAEEGSQPGWETTGRRGSHTWRHPAPPPRRAHTQWVVARSSRRLWRAPRHVAHTLLTLAPTVTILGWQRRFVVVLLTPSPPLCGCDCDPDNASGGGRGGRGLEPRVSSRHLRRWSPPHLSGSQQPAAPSQRCCCCC